MRQPEITRRDFVNGVMLGAGASLLTTPASVLAATAPFTAPGADWYGYGGIGDYAPSHGNSPDVVAAAHAIRDGQATVAANVIDTGEVYDVVIVGAGLAGLGAAYEFTKAAGGRARRALVLDNHPIFGGEAKRNEFMVAGELLIAPQGSNGFSIPGVDEGAHASADALYYDELRVPHKFAYQDWQSKRPALALAPDHATFMYWTHDSADVGFVYSGESKPVIARNPWRNKLQDAPLSGRQREQLLAWRYSDQKPYSGEDWDKWLDGMSYKAYIEKVMGLDASVTAYADPILAYAVGLGCDAVSAYAAYAILLPGVVNYYPPHVKDFSTFDRHSFPGGNDGFSRCFLKKIVPGAIRGDDSFAATLNGPIDFAALDAPDQPVRVRLNATASSVRHASDRRESSDVIVTYLKDGRSYRVRARGVVMATGGWINKYVVQDLPASHREAFASLRHAPFLVANVALKNWRFMYDAGISACRYDGGVFGTSCNVRRPMTVGDYQPPNDPDRPTVLTFYVPFIYPGMPVAAQCARGRAELFTTSYADYERRIVQQLQALFGQRFDPKRDLAGIILNRWGHAYVVPEPGFYFGRDGKRAARDVIREPFGRIAFGHSELQGNQHWGPAAAEGARAMRQVLERI